MSKPMTPAGRNGFRLLALLGLFCCSALVFAQPKAAFGSTTSRTGCSPLIVSFSDSSAGNPTQWRWDLGNGVTSLLRNPSATYFNPGTYTVKLLVQNAAGVDSVIKSTYVTVFPDPTTTFTASKTAGCFPLAVDFTDGSSANTGTIASWFWDFGDGTTSVQQSPRHIYTAAGNFTVTLRVTNTAGCSKSLTKTSLVTVTDGVKANFTNTVPGACAAPATIGFTNTSTGAAPLLFAWNFGDGNTSVLQNPSNTYTVNGAYTVTLVVTSPQGCTDTLRKDNLINIGNPKADFLAPDTICAGQPFILNNTSLPTPVSNQWNFGNGNTSTQSSPTLTYISPGTYTVKLRTNFGGCADSAIKDVVVSPTPKPSFTSNATVLCKLPATVSFTNQTPGGEAVVWDFGDGATDTAQNPVHVYTTAGNYTVKLTVTNAPGCSTTLPKTSLISVQPPQVILDGLPRNGCSPLTITPTANIAGPQTITSYLWKFGDGTVSTQAAPTHTYTGSGTYAVTLVFTTAAGCTDSVVVREAVKVGIKPSASFTVQPKDVCAYRAVSFFDNSSGNADQWFWTFGDGGTSTLQNPTYAYSDTGWFNVQLIVYNNTCPDTLRINRAVHIKPPIALFSVQNSCANKYTKTFRDASIGATSWFWSFGDGTTSTQQNPTHTYQTTGSYQVSLTVSNDSCSHTTALPLRVIDEKAGFTGDSLACRNAAKTFVASGIQGANIATWRWSFGDGSISTTDSAATHSYSKAGTYEVTLIITDLLGCSDTAVQSIRVFGPTAAFSAAPGVSCFYGNNSTFSDSSVSDGLHPIQRWEWNYGDGTIDSTGKASYTHKYAATGTYAVSLLVTDSYGCSDFITRPAAITIVQPKADFYSPDTATCTGKAVSFVNNSTGSNLQFAWSFGDGNTSTTINPVHPYTGIGTYDIKLLVTDQYGCKDSLFRPMYVGVSYPRARMTVSDSFSTCPPLLVHFAHQSTDYSILRWNFGDGTSSVLDSPSHFYTAAGTYKAVLTVSGPGGCVEKAEQTIVIKGPSGTFSYAPLSGCRPLTVNFVAVAKNIATYTWDFADGNVSVTSDSLTTYTYSAAGDYLPRLILTDAGGCSVPITGLDTIHVKGINAGFQLNTARFCNDGNVQFTNTTVGNDFITAYHWDFGDGTTSTLQTPAHNYTSPGQYTVSLHVTSQTGCVDSVSYTDTVRVHANPIVSIAQDSSGCIPLRVRFNGNIVRGDPALLRWQWNFGNSSTDTMQSPAAQLYATAGTYPIVLHVTDDHGCRDTATAGITAYPIPTVDAGPDVWVCRGNFTTLTATGAATYHWNPSPTLSCTDCATTLAAPTDMMQYLVMGTSAFGCQATDSVTVRVHQPFVLQVGAGDTVCSGRPVHLLATGADKYSWVPTTGVAAPGSGVTTANPAVTTLYKVVATDNAGCFTDTGSVYIKVWPYPVVNAGPDKTVNIGQSVLLQPTYSADVISYRWTNPQQTASCTTCPAPTILTRSAQQNYLITVTNEGGCEAKDDITVHAICNGGNLFIPNAFSPNGDGKNDAFYPRGSGLAKIKSLRIYNRWGETVFNAENIQPNDAEVGWDGRYKGLPLSPDVYVYTCEVVCINSEVLTYNGNVTLLK